MDQEVRDHLFRTYTTADYNRFTGEWLFSNFTPPIQLVITDSTGRFVEKVGSAGRGPEEILSSRYFGFDDSANVLVLDKTSAFFKLYYRDRSSVTSFDYPIKDGVSVTSRNLEYCEDNWYAGLEIIGEPPLPEVPNLVVFDQDFQITDTLGAYDPYFEGRRDIMQETLIAIDCEQKIIYTTHAKLPFIQKFSLSNDSLLVRSETVPGSFNLSDTFISMVTSRTEMNRYLSEDQSLSVHLLQSDSFIYHVFRNERTSQVDNKITNSDYYLALYDKATLEYLGEFPIPGLALGNNDKGEILVLIDEVNYRFKLLGITENETREF